MKNIELGTIYNLSKKYRDGFELAVVTMNPETSEIAVKLVSSWNSSYDEVHQYGKSIKAINVINEYQA